MQDTVSHWGGNKGNIWPSSCCPRLLHTLLFQTNTWYPRLQEDEASICSLLFFSFLPVPNALISLLSTNAKVLVTVPAMGPGAVALYPCFIRNILFSFPRPANVRTSHQGPKVVVSPVTLLRHCGFDILSWWCICPPTPPPTRAFQVQ